MRRLLLPIVVVSVALTGSAPARAHSCSTPVEIPVGESTTIVVGVPAELQPVVGIDITIPDGFRLDKAEEVVGPWKLERDGAQLRYRGGELSPYACASFQIQGAAQREALLPFALTAHGADGSRIDFTSEDPNDLHAAQLVYAGITPPGLPAEEDGGSGGGLPGSAIGLAAAGAAIAGAFFLSRRQQRRVAAPAPKRKSPAARRRR